MSYLRCDGCYEPFRKGDTAFLLESDEFLCNACHEDRKREDTPDRLNHGHPYVANGDESVTDPRLPGSRIQIAASA